MTTPRFNPQTVTWVNTPPQLDHLIHTLTESREITFDLETTGLDEHVGNGYPPRIALASFTLPDGEEGRTYLLPLSHPESPWIGRWRSVMARAAEAMAASPQRVIGHNLKFDMRWTHAHSGVDMAAATWMDTYVLAKLADENGPGKLKPLCSQLYGIPEWSEDLPVPLTVPGAAEMNPLIDLGVYAAQDTFWTWKLSQRLRDILWLDPDQWDRPVTPEEWIDAGVGNLARRISIPTLQTLTAVEQRGIRLDLDWCRSQLIHLEQAEKISRAKLLAYYSPDDLGPVSFAPTSKWWLGWAEGMVRMGHLQVTARTKTGAAQWNKAVLERLSKSGYPAAAEVLEMRDASKKAEFIRAWMELEFEGKLHPNFNLGRTVTGRLSSSNPNLQQVTSALKPAFIPSQGSAIIEVDLSQIELRLAAHVSKCGRMIKAYRAGEDLHRLTASQVARVPLEAITPAQRQQAKAVNFGFLYGMQPPKFRIYAEDTYGVELTEEEAFAAYETYFSTYPELKDWHRRTIGIVHRDQMVLSPIGRVRRFDYVDSEEERQAINSPIQGMGSDIMMIGCSLIEGFIPSPQDAPELPPVKLIGTVHDSLVVETPIVGAVQAAEAIIWRMTHGASRVLQSMGCDLLVPLEAEAAISSRWGAYDIDTITGGNRETFN